MDTSLQPIRHTFDALAPSYAAILGIESVNRELLAPVLSSLGGRILEVGCGPATFALHYFLPDRHTLFAVDFCPGMLVEAREILPHAHVACATADALPFPPDTFDAVTCVNTLHNFPSWDHVRLALAEMARVLRPGGALLVECRNSANPERRRISRFHDRDTLPQKSYRFARFREAAESLGLQPEARIALYGRHETSGLPARFARPRAVRLSPWSRRNTAAPRFALIATKCVSFQQTLNNSANPPEVTP